jgi:hypothetical protein
MKYLVIILVSFLFASCNQEELQKQNEAAFIDLVKNQIEMNDKELPHALKQINKQGNHSLDKEIYQKMLKVQLERQKASEQMLLSDFQSFNDSLISNYQSFLQKIVQQDDSFSIRKSIQQDLITIQNMNPIGKEHSRLQRTVWLYHCLYLESFLLELYGTRIGYSCGFGTRANTFSDTNPQIGEPYEILISSIPLRFEGIAYDGVHYVIVHSFEFWIDGVKTKIEYELERVEDAGVLRFTPPKNGKYRIWGAFHARFDNDERLFISHKMTHRFEVK